MPAADHSLILPWKRALPVALVLLLLASLPLLTLSPPTDDALGFSTDRAWRHLQEIAKEPHPHGSPANLRVRNYLLDEFRALGIQVETHESQVVRGNYRLPYRIVNLIARIPGTASTRPVLLASHYDSKRDAPGAGDSGAAVAALLDVARVLKSSEPLRNDVVILLTDAEELGLLGAQALVRDHTWPADVGVVFNFDARGTSGPSIMYETSRGNRWLIREYARAVEHPTASSFSDAVYQHMPNDSDFTILRAPSPLTRPKSQADLIQIPSTRPAAPTPQIPGLNFAFIGSYTHYHTPGDNLQNISRASMRHHGLNALSLAKHFGNLDLSTRPDTSDAIYFDLLNIVVIRYPIGLAVPLAIIASLAAIAVLIVGFRGGGGGNLATLHPGRIILHFFLLILPPLVAGGIAWPIAALLGSALDRAPGTAVAGFTFLSLTITTGCLALSHRRFTILDLTAAATHWAIPLAITSAILLPGGSYLLLIPLLSLAVALLLLTHHLSLVSHHFHVSPARIAALVAPAIPILLVLPATIYLAYLGLRVGARIPLTQQIHVPLAAPLTAIPTAVCLTLLPQIRLALGPRPWIVPTLAAIAALICFATVTAG